MDNKSESESTSLTPGLLPPFYSSCPPFLLLFVLLLVLLFLLLLVLFFPAPLLPSALFAFFAFGILNSPSKSFPSPCSYFSFCLPWFLCSSWYSTSPWSSLFGSSSFSCMLSLFPLILNLFLASLTLLPPLGLLSSVSSIPSRACSFPSHSQSFLLL